MADIVPSRSPASLATAAVLAYGRYVTDPSLLREICEPVDLCLPDGRLDPRAVGWSRSPLHRSNLRGRGRNKRWEYWAVQTPEIVLALTVSDLDYAGLHAVWFLAPGGKATGSSRLAPLAGAGLPDRSAGGPVRVRSGPLAIDLLPDADGVTLHARIPEGPDAWATLDHGRGRWPYRVTWNWGSGSGRVGDHVVGIQVGGKWTDGTGSTENALTVDGVLHPVAEELVWEYDRADWSAPWRVYSPRSGRIDLTFRPEHERRDRTELVVLGNETHQCFGTWHGTVVDDRGAVLPVDGIHGWVEEVRNRW